MSAPKYDVLREFGVDLRLRDSENAGPTWPEDRMADEIVRLRAVVARVEAIAAKADETPDDAWLCEWIADDIRLALASTDELRARAGQ